MEKFKRTSSIVMQERFAKSNDLPVFVKLMIQKDRNNFFAKKLLEAKRLMGVSDDRVNVTKLTETTYKLVRNYEYADSRANLSDNRVSKKQHPKVQRKIGIQLSEVLGN